MWKKVISGGVVVGVCTLAYMANVGKVYTSRPCANYTEKIGNYVQMEPKYLWDENWDFRQPQPSSKTDAEMEKEDAIRNANGSVRRHILLIRHGQYNLNGATDKQRCLTPLGREQATLTGKRLKELNIPVNEFVKSTMTRAQETGDLILAELSSVSKVSNCNLLEEGAPIPPEPYVRAWNPSIWRFYQDQPRLEAAFRRYFYRPDYRQEKDSYTVLVCHGNVIRYFLCRALQLPPEAWLRMTINHASITIISVGMTGRTALKGYNDIGFMPVDLITDKFYY